MRRAAVASVLGLFALLSGCATKQYLEAAEKVRTKNPHAAIEYLRLALAGDPENERAIDLLDEICQRIGDEHRDRLESYDKSGDFEDGVLQCDRLIASAKVVSELPGLKRVPVRPDDRTRFCKKAAVKFYDRGLELEKQGSAKEAAVAFRRAIGFEPGHKDADQRYRRNRQSATTRVALLHFRSRDAIGGGLTRTFTNGLLQAVVGKRPEFIDLVTPDAQPRAQARLEGELDASPGDTGWRRSPGTNTIQSFKLDQNGQAMRDPKTGAFLFRNYTTTWIRNDRSTSCQVTARFKIVGGDGVVLAADEASQSRQDSACWVSNLQGDVNIPNAVPADIAALPRAPQEPRAPRDLAADCVDPLIATFADRIFARFK